MEDFSVFEFKTKVNANDSDSRGRARLTTVLDFLQNAAWAHYRHFERSGGHSLSRGLGWVVSKIRLNIVMMPLWEEEVVATTWSPGFEKLYAMRNFELKTKGGEMCAQASIAWLVINPEKKKPVKPDEYAKVWPFKKTPLLADVSGKVARIENPEIRKEFTAAYSDIDVNRHVNNVKYIQWMMDAYDYDFLMKNTPADVSINFVAEAKEGDRVLAGMKKAEGSPAAVFSNIINAGTGKELCRAKIVWKEG